MKTIKNIGKWFMFVALMSGSVLGTSCSESNTEQPKMGVTLAGDGPVYYNTLQRWLQVQAGGDWTISVTYAIAGEDWCTIAPTSGTGSKNVVMTMTENEDDNPREATIEIKAEGTTSTLVVTQLDSSQGDALNPPLPPDPGGVSPVKVDKMTSIPQWMELPATTTLYGKSAVVTHSTRIGTTNARNFTMLYDTVQRVAYWVAYPISNSYLGSQKRTDKWAYDPKVPFAYQPNLTSGYPEQESGKNKYDRGHQMPSADRTISYDANAQTFYFTNMTAQQWQFNQKIWAALEDDVRAWAKTADTMYVVTGAILGSPILYTKDKSGKDIAVPKNYFKALLSRKGAGTYKAIGFWFENKIYDNNTITSAYSKSITQLEALTGFTFFPNLPDQSIKELYRPQDWGL